MKYKQAGVDITEASVIKKKIKEIAEKTYNKKVLAGVGPFGALYDLGGGKVLVSSTDGVGTKIEIAKAMGFYRSSGIDIVNHCVNDILCQGAKPLFFLDYIAQDRLRDTEVIQIIEGMASACLEAKIPLIGGELAQMPDIYLEGKSDIAGTIIGLVGKKQVINGAKIRPGDKIIGLPSTGPHTNGYSLIRKIFSEKFNWLPNHFWHLRIEELDCRLGDAVLQPHRSYLKPVSLLLKNRFEIHGIAHITGGGLPGNIIRILPGNCQAWIRPGSWPVPPIFQYIQKQGEVSSREMYQVFNMGVGMVLIVSRETSEEIHKFLWADNEPRYFIGEIVKGKKEVKLVFKNK